MIRAIHIEDEPGNIKLLETLLNTFCKGLVDLVGNASNINDGIILIQQSAPELVFLDIELSGGTSFDLLEKNGNNQFEIIFITAHIKYAINAIKANAADYLLKPIDTKELIQSIDKVSERINSRKVNEPRIGKAAINFEATDIDMNITLPSDGGLIFLPASKVIKLEALGSCTKVYIENERSLVCTKSLKEIAALFPPKYFMRVHHSWVVNIQKVNRYFRGKNSYLTLTDGTTVPVSVRKKGEFLNRFYH